MDQKKGRSKLICMLLAIFMVLAGITIAGEQQEDWTVYAATTGNNAQYSLQGAVYWVYTNQSCTTRAVDENGNYAVLTTNANGETGTVSLDRGTYYVKEKTASTGYTLDTTVYTAIVTAGATTWVNPSGNNRVKEIPQSAPISIQKIDETTGKTAIAGAQFEVTYSDGRNISRTWVVKTGSDGIANLDDAHFVSGDARYKNSRNQYVVPLGTVTVKEKKAPHNYAKSNEIFTITIRGDGSTNETTTNVSGSGNKGGTISTNPIKVNFKNKLQSAPFAIRKTDAVTGQTTPSPGSTFKGAEFEVKCVSDQFTRTWRIKADENGLANLDNDHFVSGDARFKNYAGQYALPVESTVTVKEVKAPKGYKLSNEVWTFTIKGDDTGNDTTTNIKGRGSQSGDTDINPLNMKVKETPQSVTPTIQKYDAETGKPVPGGGASLAGAEYEIRHDDGAGTVRTWIVKTDENGVANLDDDHFVSGDERYQNSEGEYALRLGTVTVKETKPPKGYLKSEEVFTVTIEGDTTGNETTGNVEGEGSAGGTVDSKPFQINFSEQVKRGDIELIKIDGGSDNFMEGIPFSIKSIATGETHVFVTNVNGHATTKVSPTTDAPNRNKHTYKTNENDYVIDENGKPVLVDGKHVDTTNLDPELGIWFEKDAAGNVTKEINDALGALPYGEYYITELPVPANDGKNLIKNLKFVVSHDGVVVDGGTRANLPYALQTEATDAHSNIKIGTVADNASIKDRVSYRGLTVNKNYILKAEAHWAKESGHDLIDGGIVTDANGNEIRSEKSFTPSSRDGFVNMTLGTFDSTHLYANGEELKGEKVVIFEYLYLIENDEELLLVAHEDPEDDDQTITYPWVETELTDSDTNIRMGLAREDMELVDHVVYKNFVPNYVYTFRATLYDKETGQVLKDSQGNTVRTTEDHRLTRASGTVDLRYTFDSTHLENKSIVSMVEIYGGGMPSIAHENIDDEEQTLHIPKIRTKATDSSTADEVGKVVGPLTDTVTYENLLPGYDYKMSASMMDKETGAAIGATGETSFKAEASAEDPTRADGTVDVTVNLPAGFDKEDIEGKTLVAFEQCYVKKNTQQGKPPASDKVVAIHADIDDAAQTLHYPKIRTTGVDWKTDDHVGTVGASEIIKDKVTYWNLVPGKSYTIRGMIVDAETGETIATADDLTFTATATDAATGTKTIAFGSINSASLAGKTVVCYEKLIHNDVEVTQHEEQTDEAQSVHYPWLKTTATDSLTGDHVSSIFGRLINAIRRTTGDGIPVDHLETIIDTVEYRNLIPGEEYKLSGTLMNKETGEAITGPNGKPVTAEVTLAANRHQANGSTELKFLVDSSENTNTTFVCYEKLFHKNPVTGEAIEVNRHENLNDESQSVHAVRISTEAVDENTGVHVGDTTGMTSIKDTVAMKNLVSGMEYTLKGTLYNKTTGEPVLGANEHPVTAEKTFTAEGGDDDDKRVDLSETLSFTIDGRTVAGQSVVVFEDLYHNDVRITTHSDLNDDAQTVCYPMIRTSLTDKKNGEKETQISSETQLADVVSYKNLLPGKYKLSGILMDKNSGESLKDSEGKEITTEDVFTIKTKEEGKNGSRELIFTLDTSQLRSHVAVAYETLTLLDEDDEEYSVPIAKHEDLNDTKQSEWIIDIATKLTDTMTSSDEGEARENAEFKDRVSFWGLIPGKQYTMKGILMDKETGKAIKDADGNTITAKTVFTPAENSGTVDVIFKANTSNLAGKSVVAFESLSPKNELDKVIAEHKDIEDAAQTVNIIGIKTNATDEVTGIHEGGLNKETVIVDRVTYTNLTAGREYILKARLMDKNTGKALLVKGKELTKTVQITPEERDGYIDVEFKLDTRNLAGSSIVAFERLFSAENEDTMIAHHEDLKDAAQTVYIPEIGTFLTDSKTGAHIAYAGKKEILIDSVAYKNLAPGEEHVLKGTLMDKATGKPLVVDGKPVTTEKVFTPKESAGTEKIEFAIDATNLTCKTVVAFEELYIKVTRTGTDGNEVLVAEHKALDDENQSIYIPKIKTRASYKTTRKVSDEVGYENLAAGNYIARGWLVDKNSGKRIEGTNGEESFTLKETGSGTTTVILPVPKTYAGKAVAFEELYVIDKNGKEIIVAEHKNINDDAQTVVVPEAPATGESTRILLYAATFTCALLLALIVAIRKKYAA